MKKQRPNPGSDAAIQLDCSCPTSDNAYGKGADGSGKLFWIQADCPLHGSAAMKKWETRGRKREVCFRKTRSLEQIIKLMSKSRKQKG
jgi:hypothetical protein